MGFKYELIRIDIKSVSHFLECVERIKTEEEDKKNDSDLLFRGQCVDKPLVPKLARLPWKGHVLVCEKLILEEFARRLPPFAKPGLDDKWDRLAIAQHYGLPTRLLDWTYSATAALWFAVNGAGNNGNGAGVVWVMKPVVNDFINFPTKESPFDRGRTRIFRPRIIADRISAQSGVFTVHAAHGSGISTRFVPLEHNRHFSLKLVKMIVPARRFEKVRKQLDACGVNASTMYPDLVGLCEHLQWRYTH